MVRSRVPEIPVARLESASLTIFAVSLKLRRQSSKEFPAIEHRRLAAGFAVFRQQIPDGRAADAKTPAGFRNTHAGIIVNKPAPRHGFQQPRPFLAAGRLVGE